MGQYDKQCITNAAIMYQNGEVLEGKNYHKINSLANRLGISGDRIHGFLNSSGEFVLPIDAAQIATESGQLKKPVSELSPDDLWPTLQTD